MFDAILVDVNRMFLHCLHFCISFIISEKCSLVDYHGKLMKVSAVLH